MFDNINNSDLKRSSEETLPKLFFTLMNSTLYVLSDELTYVNVLQKEGRSLVKHACLFQASNRPFVAGNMAIMLSGHPSPPFKHLYAVRHRGIIIYRIP